MQNSKQEIPKITVVVRKRPINELEIQRNDFDIAQKLDENHIVLKEPKFNY